MSAHYYWDDLTDEQKAAWKARRQAEVAALLALHYPFLAHHRGKRVKVIAEISMVEPYKSAPSQPSKPRGDMIVESKEDGEYITGAASLTSKGKPLLTPRPPEGRMYGPYPKDSSSTVMDRPERVHMYRYERGGATVRGYLVPPKLQNDPFFLFGRFSGGALLGGKLDRRTRSVDQLAVEAIAKRFGVETDVHYRAPTAAELAFNEAR